MKSISLEPAPDRPSACRIRIGTGLWPALVEGLRAEPLGARYALVTDSTVRRLHGERLAELLVDAGLAVDVVDFPAGEIHKNRETRAMLEDRLVELSLGRDGAVLAVGGGVVGDLAGFVAATYHRGVPWMHVPTTLLAMVDASIGGKTGHDLPGGKNLVGAFHHPASVWAELSTLKTLPDPEMSEGFAEMVKAAAVTDAGLLERLAQEAASLQRREPAPLAGAVADAVRVKVGIVAGDPRETGRRALLNFGHTVGHALEAASGYRMRHGQAVATGMLVESWISARRAGLPEMERDRLRKILSAYGLGRPVPDDLSPGQIWEACLRDKKVRRGAVRCVLLRRLGEAARSGEGWTFAVEREEVVEAIASVR